MALRVICQAELITFGQWCFRALGKSLPRFTTIRSGPDYLTGAYTNCSINRFARLSTLQREIEAFFRNSFVHQICSFFKLQRDINTSKYTENNLQILKLKKRRFTELEGSGVRRRPFVHFLLDRGRK